MSVRTVPRRLTGKGRDQGAADAALGGIRPGEAIYGLTSGRWSPIEGIWAMLDQAGRPVDLRVSTWRMGVDDAGALREMLDCGAVRSVRILLDRSVHQMDRAAIHHGRPTIWGEAVKVLGRDALRVWTGHAKFVCLSGEKMRLFAGWSMNLNRCRRSESFHVVADDEIHDFHARVVDDIFGEPPARWEEPGGAHREREARKRTQRVLGADDEDGGWGTDLHGELRSPREDPPAAFQFIDP